MIQINDNLRIKKIDKLNLILEERVPIKKKDGTVAYQWELYGYYGKLKMALQGALSHELFNLADEKLVMRDILARIDKIEQELKGVIK